MCDVYGVEHLARFVGIIINQFGCTFKREKYKGRVYK
jgi:hypothetical protein